MNFYVYLLITKRLNRYITYVGYTNDINKRLELHNSSRGAKFTKGKNWKIIFKKKFSCKSLAMKEEYKLKKDYKFRKYLKNKYLKKNANSNITSL
ncbi:MAG: excinuclease ABC subunit C [Flavobacteriaceae bacterium]|nr:excinuclease ABC subunit C [Flavobacteriaceae bacterium]|tara:strand:- start:7410 stop:7694 length:285 start_codon:yes stop_codon:yes gene_type:complete